MCVILLLPVAHRTMTIAATVVMIMNMPALRIIALILMISHGSGAALSNLCKYLPGKRVNMFSVAVNPDDLLNCMTGLQISCADFGTLAIWLSSLKSSSK